MVMGVLVLLAVVAMPAYSSLFAGRKTTLAANLLNGAVIEARAHAVSNKVYTALVFVKEGNGYRSFRLAEVFHNTETENNAYAWRRWAPDSAFVLLPENTMIPATDKDFGTTNSSDGSSGSSYSTKVSNLANSGLSGSTATAIIFKPNGQLAGTEDNNLVVRFVEINRYEANAAQTPKLPLNINWLTCKTKFLDPVQ